MRLLTTLLLLSISPNVLTQTTVRNWVHTEEQYSDADGNTLTITNSFPKGGGTYTDSEGNTYSYVVFWYRVTNEFEAPMELELNFPAGPFRFFPSSESHIRLFLPSETMTLEKIDAFDYGLSNLKDILDALFNKPARLKKTINPKKEYLFYVSMLMYQVEGTARTALVVKGNDLYYEISINPNSAQISCGKITFKN